LPLAASTVLESPESATTWPSTTPAATTARKNGHGLLGETAVCGVGASPEALPTLSSCMSPNPEKHRIPQKAPNDETD
jgi:hypothetical protein